MGNVIETRSAAAPAVMLLLGAIMMLFPALWIIGIPLIAFGGILFVVRVIGAAGEAVIKHKD